MLDVFSDAVRYAVRGLLGNYYSSVALFKNLLLGGCTVEEVGICRIFQFLGPRAK